MAGRRAHSHTRRIAGTIGFVLIAGGVVGYLLLPRGSGTGAGKTAEGRSLRSTEPGGAGLAATASQGEQRQESPSPRTDPLLKLDGPSPTSHPTSSKSSEPAAVLFQNGLKALARSEWIPARMALNDALDRGLPPREAAEARAKLSELSDRLIFSPARLENDPLVESYVVQKGDYLARIAARNDVTQELLAQVNRLQDRDLVRIGQSFKVIRGPFHAVVDKSDHELYVYLGDTFIKGFRVALGMNGITPTGKWVVKDRLKNPSWRDPSGKFWHQDDPQNPIGEYWIGLEGVEGNAVGQVGFGIHGTIEEDTIGQNVSLGCIRLAAKDIELVYKLMVPRKSTVVVRE